ncbi:hypothetical protein ACTMJF_24030 [Escherichia coli]|uniref:hypothetical protein n=1 Tax=Escherichia coli TaxID=562 RepID=UPI003F8C7651
MNEYKITLSDGDYFYTRFNGTIEEAERYYLGHVFNTGTERDHLVKCVSVELLNQ